MSSNIFNLQGMRIQTSVFAAVLARMPSEMRTLIDKYIGSSSECADDTFRSTGLMVIGTAR